MKGLNIKNEFKTVLTVIKKEFVRFFKDYRLVITAILLPGILMYAVYSLMGTIMENMTKEQAEYKPSVIIQNAPESLTAAFGGMYTVGDFTSGEEAMTALKNGGCDLYVIFPDNFEAVQPNTEPAPNIEAYYDSASTNSYKAFTMFTAFMDAYESSVVNLFNVNAGNKTYDIADGKQVAVQVLSMVVPLVLVMMLFSGCMSVAPESIAGEKERGTMATMLVTPVKRSSIAVGKIVALSCIALLSGLASSLGLILSLPKIAGSQVEFSFAMYGVGDYFAILGVILTTVLILVSLISIISAFAKSVKEASGMVVPLMLVILACGIASMFAASLTSIGFYFVPILNSVLVISNVLSGAISGVGVAITIVSNLVYSALLAFVLARMFNSERIMFNK